MAPVEQTRLALRAGPTPATRCVGVAVGRLVIVSPSSLEGVRQVKAVALVRLAARLTLCSRRDSTPIGSRVISPRRRRVPMPGRLCRNGADTPRRLIRLDWSRISATCPVRRANKRTSDESRYHKCTARSNRAWLPLRAARPVHKKWCRRVGSNH